MLKEILDLILSFFKEERKEMFTKEDTLILAKTIYGEARGEISQGKVAVGCVVMNRYYSKKWFAGSTLAGTCMKKMQFSCWNENDPNRKILENITQDKLGDCYIIAKNLTGGIQQDITNESRCNLYQGRGFLKPPPFLMPVFACPARAKKGAPVLPGLEKYEII
jgi:hypothetical protein